MIFQLLDDHSRYAVASLVAASENATAAIAVFDKAVAAHGVPQRLLTDNGAALNPTRRGFVGMFVDHVTRLGVKAITGKPYKPTTQGKNERFRQTLFRYLDQQPLAADLAGLQAQVDAFDRIYNTQRPHQGLPGRVTPLTAWQATAKVKPPRPLWDRPAPDGLPDYRPAKPSTAERTARAVRSPAAEALELPTDTCLRTLTSAGTFMLDRVQYKVGGHLSFESVLVVTNGAKIIVTDLHGEVLIEHTRPGPGVRYVGNGKPRGPHRRSVPEVSPMS